MPWTFDESAASKWPLTQPIYEHGRSGQFFPSGPSVRVGQRGLEPPRGPGHAPGHTPDSGIHIGVHGDC